MSALCSFNGFTTNAIRRLCLVLYLLERNSRNASELKKCSGGEHFADDSRQSEPRLLHLGILNFGIMPLCSVSRKLPHRLWRLAPVEFPLFHSAATKIVSSRAPKPGRAATALPETIERFR